MQQLMLERRIREVHARLGAGAPELAVLDEQLAVSARGGRRRPPALRSSPRRPSPRNDYVEIQRHADAMTRAHLAMASTVADLVAKQDDLLSRVGSSS